MGVTDTASDDVQAIVNEVRGAVVLDDEFLEVVLTAVVAGGNVLLEDVPGTGKTLTARSIAEALGLEFSRVQFTPDLLPADITGSSIFDEERREFVFEEGPIFANVVLADEINRAPPKTQSALLEAMEEGQVTVDGTDRSLPEPFFVIATQNPVEQEGTFPLPEAQLDRFWVKTTIGYPDPDGESQILRRRTQRNASTPSVRSVLTDTDVRQLLTEPETIAVTDELIDYMRDIARQTRDDDRVRIGVSPRGTQRLLELARAHAVLVGREFVVPADVKTMAVPALAHRLVLTTDAEVEQVDKRAVIQDVLDTVPVPRD